MIATRTHPFHALHVKGMLIGLVMQYSVMDVITGFTGLVSISDQKEYDQLAGLAASWLCCYCRLMNVSTDLIFKSTFCTGNKYSILSTSINPWALLSMLQPQ